MKKLLRAIASRVLVIVNLHQTPVGRTIKLLDKINFAASDPKPPSLMSVPPIMVNF